MRPLQREIRCAVSQVGGGSQTRTNRATAAIPLRWRGVVEGARVPACRTRPLHVARRVVAKVGFHFGHLFPRIGFIVTNLEADSRAVVRFYSPTRYACG